MFTNSHRGLKNKSLKLSLYKVEIYFNEGGKEKLKTAQKTTNCINYSGINTMK